MKSVLAFLVTGTILLLVSMFNPAFAQPTQLSYLVNLNSFTLRVTYPSEAMPGDTVTVIIQGSPNSNSVYLQSLTVIIYYADATGLHQLGNQNLVSNPANGYGYYGSYPTGSFSKSFTVNVPQNASRTSLIAIFSETVQFNNYYYYNYWSFGYPCADPVFCGYYPSYITTTDDAIAPLSYIKATTPEYLTLQQQMNQTQAQNKQLQTTISQQTTMINQLNQQLTSANATTQTYQMILVVFVITAVALAVFNLYQSRSKEKMQKTNETKTAKSEQ